MKTNFTQHITDLKQRTKFILCAFLFVLVSVAANAAAKTWNGSTSTDWNTAANWSPSGVPGSADDAIIPTLPTGLQFPVITTGSFALKSLTIQTGASVSITGGTLLVSGANWSVSGTLNVSGGTLLTSFTLTVNNGGIVNLSSGTIHTANAIGTAPTDLISVAAGGTINQTGGTLDVYTLTIASGTIPGIYNQSGGTLNHYNSFKNSGTFNGTGGTIDFKTTAAAAFSISATNQFYNVIIDAGVDPDFDGNTGTNVYIAGDFTNNNTALNESNKCTFNFNGTGDQNIYSASTGTNVTFGSLNVNKTSGIASLTSNVVVIADLSVTSGTLNLSTYTANRKASGGTLSVANGATLQLGANTGGQTGSNFPTNYSTVTLSSGSTVEYNGDNTITQTIYATPTYQNLTLTNGSGSGSATKNTTANISVSGNLTINSGAVLTPGAAYTVGGTGTLKGSGTAQVTRTTATADFLNQYTITNKTYTNLIVDYTSTSQAINSITYGGLQIDANLPMPGSLTVNKSLNLNGGDLDLAGYTLTLGGTISGSGKLKGSSTSGLIIASSGTVGTLNFDQTTDATTNALDSILITGGTVTLGNKLNLYNVLNISAGTFNLNGVNFVLKSNSSNTASVGQVLGTLSGATNVTVERYIANDGRKYRIITPGVTTTSSIKANWMEGGMNTVIGTNINPNPGYGTQITGSGGNTNGFDVSQTNATSLYTYNNTTQSWVAVTNTNGTLQANQAYLIFIRGDRSVDLTATGTNLPSTATILRATGTLTTGNQSTSVVGNGTFNLVANPFGSAVDWNGVYTDVSNNVHVNNTYTYWDPKMGTRGAYVSVTNLGTKSNISSIATTDVQTGQGFFVQTKTGTSNSNLSIKESHKSAKGKNNVNILRTASQLQQLAASLYFYDAQNNRINADGVTALFDNSFSAAVDGDDAVQVANWDEDIALKRNGQSLSIESRPQITTNDTLFLTVARLKQQQYELQFDPSNMSGQGLTAFLIDNYLNTQTPISLDQPSFIAFNVTSNAASSAANRFYITFRASATLPVKLLSFSGKKSGDDNVLNWTSATEENFDHYELLYSTDQNNFNKIASIAGKGNASDYLYTHSNVTSNTSYYRLKMVDKNGSETLSNIVMIRRNDAEIMTVSHIYPNPFIDNISVDINSQIDTSATVLLVDINGKEVRRMNVSITKGMNNISLKNLGDLGTGVYMLSVKSETFEFNSQVVKGKQ